MNFFAYNKKQYKTISSIAEIPNWTVGHSERPFITSSKTAKMMCVDNVSLEYNMFE